jgi:hypothetical protein
MKKRILIVFNSKRFTSRSTPATLARLDAAISNVQPIGEGEPNRSAVRAVQSALADLNKMYLLPVQIDGFYGPRTSAAVEAFQRDYGLFADGFVGRQTMGQLDAIYSNALVRSPVGRSINVGLNRLGPGYGGAAAPLASCINDAEGMESMASSLGYSTCAMTNESATTENFITAMRLASENLFSGDALLVSFSGHGAQIPSTGIDEDESDGLDETLCFYDRMLVDNEFYSLLSEFRAGVRIFTVFDSCHSGTVAKNYWPALPSKDVGTSMIGSSLKGDLVAALTKMAMVETDLGTLTTQPISRQDLRKGFVEDDGGLDPVSIQVKTVDQLSTQTQEALAVITDLAVDAVYATPKLLDRAANPFEKDASLYNAVRNLVGPKTLQDVSASFVGFSACQDYQTALAGSYYSEFTAKILKVWDSSHFPGDGNQILSRLRTEPSGNGAIPNLYTLGPAGPAVTYERPFVV